MSWRIIFANIREFLQKAHGDDGRQALGGKPATRRIRASEAGDPNIFIVALTAYALKGDRERFLAAGMDDYLSKPINLKELERILERIGMNKVGLEA